MEQREKIRLIDDVTICGVNGIFGLCEKLRVGTIDEMVACLLIALDSADSSSKEPKNPTLVGRCFDLQSAYKQFGVNLEDCFEVRTRKSKLLRVLALPFGATGFVADFLRLASSIAFMGVKCLHFVWTVFFETLLV